MSTTGEATQDVTADAVPDLLALERQVCFGLVVAARNVVALYRPLLEPMGLTHPQYLVLLALWERSPCSVAELARRLSLEPATISPLLRRLEDHGLVVRERDPRDERALAVSLTPRGAGLRDEARKIPESIRARLGMELSELGRLREVLDHVIAASTADDPREP